MLPSIIKFDICGDKMESAPRRKYGGMAVGLTHSRGVNVVMPIESQEPGTLEGVSSKAQRDE